ncbi:hypothetical protein HHL28_09530 [Aerophototrophica crusticola]|uniref:Uncharacterized protein n=1 Tax=Aerophototrophica crusticola TaxID=1709002 RepID=A0A858R7C4_9PROT|nr:hypothetical protein HHL28_09530 [Rhodospirillaceae bacterium B3]
MRQVGIGLLAVVLTAGAAGAADLAMEGPWLPGTVSTAENEYNWNISADGTLAVFARSAANFQGARIMVMERRGDGWTEPAPLPFTDNRYKDSDPWLAPDGRTLYFVSDRPTPAKADKKDMDIWRVTRTAAGWGTPEWLGEAVNSPGEELGPEVHGGVLTFNSSRKGSQGGLDIYAAKPDGKGGFTAPEALPAPINSASQEGDFTLAPDGKSALFWSLRGGKGEIYRVAKQGDGWGEAVKLPDAVNTGPFTFTPQFSADGKTLTFGSMRVRDGQPAGMADVYRVPTSSVLP